jgi:hypothetical protein
VFAVTGTTHLWRRGLTFDSSLAAAVCDERLVEGRPQEIRGFRRQLLADRLGVPTSRLPDDPDELVRAIRQLDETAPADDFGTRPSQRLSAIPIIAPDPTPTETDIDTWDPDGRAATSTWPPFWRAGTDRPRPRGHRRLNSRPTGEAV